MRVPRSLLRRGVLRVLAVVPVLTSLSAVGAAVAVGPSATGCARAASVHRAALVVEHGDGAVTSVCVPFSADSITGEQLLALSRVEYAIAAYGGGTGDAVCQVGNEPAQYPPSCWTASSPYWAMYVSRGGGPWTFSTLGVSSQTFHDGDAEGFRYEAQSSGAVPPSPRGVCPAATPPAPTPMATATPAAHQAAPPTHRGTAGGPLRPLTAATATPRLATPPPPSGTAPAATATPSPSPPPAVAARTSAPSPPGSMGGAGWGAAALATLLVALAAVRAVGRRGGRGHGEAGQPRR